ncbi:unnamed protein product [Periconia digitata]|uniref:Uncharacterized protein n=1 Tax=Periconia digitata TaxID=1303443 RepID=A0A9W4UQB3_9PLEO|nr:unnamed protein product [Periconia digitata]
MRKTGISLLLSLAKGRVSFDDSTAVSSPPGNSLTPFAATDGRRLYRSAYGGRRKRSCVET